MKRTTVFLEEGLLRRAQQVARREGWSFAQLVREALAQYLAGGRLGKRKLPSFVGMFASGHTDTAARAEELLWHDPHDDRPSGQ